jgi:hypothetical protein
MTALQSIIKEAKAIRKKSPKIEWKKAVAQASAIYASKHKGKSPVGKKKAVKKAAKKKAVGLIKKKITKKVARKKATTMHKDTKSHNVKISVMSGLHKIVGKVTGKYYIDYTTDSGYKKMEFFDKLPKGYYKGMDRTIYVTRLTNYGTSLIPVRYTDNNKDVKK